jgi:hypothetical protein
MIDGGWDGCMNDSQVMAVLGETIFVLGKMETDGDPQSPKHKRNSLA